MFKTVMVLGHFRGIRLEVHISWLVIFALILVTLSTTLMHHYPEWRLQTAVLTALFTALAFFASILAHELGHSLVAIRRGIPVKAITLFIFGGMAQLGKDSDNPEDEFHIAIAGPLVSFGLAAIFLALSFLFSPFLEPASVAFGWLGVINLVVAVFNMIPGFPLDGGRVFRAAIWRFTGDARKGIRAAVMGGRVVAYSLFAVGLWNGLFLGNLLGGLWIILIAWFLLTMADVHGKQFDLRQQLVGIQARDLADFELYPIDPTTSIRDWVDHYLLPRSERAALVGNQDSIHGLITLSDIRRIPPADWPDTPVSRVMTGLDRLRTVRPDTGVEEVLTVMTETGFNQLPVMDTDRVIGWIDRNRLLRALEVQLATRPRGS
ncbi:site-2 protease family protein [Gammaproteobacteria bacterium AB-CW1]|uniref:Zinc metalloprotease n=1 Tax=Natronospira elongata TaxID=3110268 RepID=A0AAP6MKF4_9GAMM|nr:site-2 protease family protein [Gammaproteobacteria bacterium AB-CW1]MEA5446279.1 site-2 protease family protein [Gammaproteobacteria bacterium AB-CW1]